MKDVSLTYRFERNFEASQVSPIVVAESHWHAAYSIMLEDIGSGDDCLVIRYEDFVRSPQRYLDQICDLVGIAKFSASQIVEDHNEKYFLDWYQRYAPEMSTLQAVLPADNPVLQRFGYSLDEPFVSDI